MLTGKQQIPVFALLILCGSAFALEDYYSKGHSRLPFHASKKAVEGDAWAKKYYSGKKVTGDAVTRKNVVTVSSTPSPATIKEPPLPPHREMKNHTTAESEPAASLAEDQSDQTELIGQSSAPRSELPPGMDRGIADLESGLADLRAYTATMAAHIKKFGLRGFLYVTPEIKAKGRAVGQKLGGGVSGIMRDVERDMISESAVR